MNVSKHTQSPAAKWMLCLPLLHNKDEAVWSVQVLGALPYVVPLLDGIRYGKAVSQTGLLRRCSGTWPIK